MAKRYDDAGPHDDGLGDDFVSAWERTFDLVPELGENPDKARVDCLVGVIQYIGAQNFIEALLNSASDKDGRKAVFDVVSSTLAYIDTHEELM